MEEDTIVLNDAKKRQRYYAVHCRCGHVGINKYIEIVFAVIASSGKEASAKARRFARVKHNKKNAIIDCYEITKEEYDVIIEANKNDPYLRCKNVQEQRTIDGFESRVQKEPEKATLKKSKKEKESLAKYRLKKQKQLIETLLRFNVYDYLSEKGSYYYENVY